MIDWPDLSDNQRLMPHQRQQLAVATQGRIGLFVGGAGVGKTYTVGELVGAIADQYGPSAVQIMAPTGKAAVRATAAIDTPGIRATTIHSGLRGRPGPGGGFVFGHNQHNPLPAPLIIIDEASMIGTDLLARLLEAIGEHSRILFVGDDAQLQPVGHGSPLRDMIAAKLPTGRLIEIHRNAGEIARIADAIRHGRSFRPLVPRDIDLASGRNLSLVRATSPAEQTDKLIRALHAAKHEGSDPVWDAQVLVARNDKSLVSRGELNRRLQDELNRDGQRNKGNPFRVRDKIICLKNDTYQTENEDEVYVANGELAQVKHVEPRLTIAAVLGTESRIVKIPHGAKGNGCPWDLGYALTVHKAQGSETPIAIVMLDRSAQHFVDRSWLYTSVTRAKQLCLLVGESEILARFARKNSAASRNTFLAELIAKGSSA